MGDWSSGVYVWGQAVALCGCVLYGLSCVQRTRVKVLIWCGVSSVFLAASYALLGGWIALVSEIIVIPRNIAMYFIDRKRTNAEKKKILPADWAVFTITTILVLAGGILTWDSWWCIAIIIGSLFYNTAIFQKNIGHYCIMGIFGILCYFVYDVFALESWVGVVFDTVLLIGGIIGTVRYYRKHRVPELADIR